MYIQTVGLMVNTITICALSNLLSVGVSIWHSPKENQMNEYLLKLAKYILHGNDTDPSTMLYTT